MITGGETPGATGGEDTIDAETRNTLPLTGSASGGERTLPVSSPPRAHETLPLPLSQTRPRTPKNDPDHEPRSTLATRPRGNAELQQITKIGRFVVLRKLGEGGMGVVYTGYDEDLDRKVAVKLLRAQLHGPRDKARLMREAQGLARLSHPNVVQIHEIGEHRGSVFVAMEFVVGLTLRDWLREGSGEDGEPAGRSRPWQETLAVLLQAGRGLEAAHRAGMVHRDFKPDNTIVGADGRLRVLDFGLVRGLGPRAGEAEGEVDASSEQPQGENENETLPVLDSGATSRLVEPATTPKPSGLLDHTLTRTGALLGTPAYMAPEQHEGLTADAAADQFAFCVTAFEALFGARPFPGRTLSVLRKSIFSGTMVEIPADTQVPARVRAAISRGLACAPDQRWPDMGALLTELEAALQPPAPPQRWGWWLAGAATVGAATFGITLLLNPATPEPCVFDDAALAGIWDVERASQLREAFADMTQSFDVTATVKAVEQRLDDWSAAWLDARSQACVQTRVEAVASEDLLDRRMACLERQRREFSGVVSTLVTAKPELVEQAPQVLAELPDLSACDRPGAEVELPRDPTQAAAVLDGFETLAHGNTLLVAGELDRARDVQESVAAIGERVGHLPLVLHARVLAGRMAFARGDYDEGAAELLDAVHAASPAHLDGFIAETRAQLVNALVGRWSAPRVETMLVDELEASLRRLEQPAWTLEDALISARAKLARARGEYARALELLARARAWRVEHGGVADTVVSITVEADILERLGRFDEARDKFGHALELARERWGRDAPVAVKIELDLGLLAAERGEDELAAAHLARAIPRMAAIHGADSLPVARGRFIASKLALRSGELEAARAELDVVLEVFTRELGPNAEETGQAHNALGVMRFHQGDYAGSIEAYTRALAIARAVHGPEHEENAHAYSNIGESQTRLGRHAEALESYAEALALMAKILPAGHPDTAYPLKGRGQSLLALGRVAEAIEALEAALALWERHGGDPFELADTRLELARALMVAGASRSRARALAEQAAEGFASIDDQDGARRARELAQRGTTSAR